MSVVWTLVGILIGGLATSIGRRLSWVSYSTQAKPYNVTVNISGVRDAEELRAVLPELMAEALKNAQLN